MSQEVPGLGVKNDVNQKCKKSSFVIILTHFSFNDLWVDFVIYVHE